MAKRPQVHSESFDRGYAKGLMDAYGIIRGMLNESDEVQSLADFIKNDQHSLELLYEICRYSNGLTSSEIYDDSKLDEATNEIIDDYLSAVSMEDSVPVRKKLNDDLNAIIYHAPDNWFSFED